MPTTKEDKEPEKANATEGSKVAGSENKTKTTDNNAGRSDGSRSINTGERGSFDARTGTGNRIGSDRSRFSGDNKSGTGSDSRTKRTGDDGVKHRDGKYGGDRTRTSRDGARPTDGKYGGDRTRTSRDGARPTDGKYGGDRTRTSRDGARPTDGKYGGDRTRTNRDGARPTDGKYGGSNRDDHKTVIVRKTAFGEDRQQVKQSQKPTQEDTFKITAKSKSPKIKRKDDEFYATGKRKTSIARVWILRGEKGKFTVNGRTIDSYFPRLTHQNDILKPFAVTDVVGNFDVKCTVVGGGVSGQAQAIRLGIAKALVEYNPEFRVALRSAELLTRDSRIVERKKYGQHKARKSTQFSKR